jgi:ADP-ribose pyrophosphatase YjhB (NUDIX family)
MIPSVSGLILTEFKLANYVLLNQRAFDPSKGLWSLPGGKLKKGESPKAGLI